MVKVWGLWVSNMLSGTVYFGSTWPGSDHREWVMQAQFIKLLVLDNHKGWWVVIRVGTMVERGWLLWHCLQGWWKWMVYEISLWEQRSQKTWPSAWPRVILGWRRGSLGRSQHRPYSLSCAKSFLSRGSEHIPEPPSGSQDHSENLALLIYREKTIWSGTICIFVYLFLHEIKKGLGSSLRAFMKLSRKYNQRLR